MMIGRLRNVYVSRFCGSRHRSLSLSGKGIMKKDEYQDKAQV